MLLALHIENIAVIKELDIDFSAGFNVLTGETGAGKSIIIDSINLIMGARADKEFIRAGEEKAIVSAVFVQNDQRVHEQLQAYGLPHDTDEVMIYKELCSDGRTMTKVNGRTVSVSALREIAKHLVTIHGQHDNQSLLKSETHILYLDAFAGLQAQKEEYKKAYEQYVAIKERIQKSRIDEQEKQRQIDLLRYQLTDIDAAKLKAGEEEALTETKKKIKDLDKINRSTAIVFKALYENDKGAAAVLLIDKAVAALTAIESHIDNSGELIEALTEIRATIEEIAYKVQAQTVSITGDPETMLTKIESRLAHIEKLQKKYGTTIEEVLAYRASLQQQLDDLLDAEEKNEALEKALCAAHDEAFRLAKALSLNRAKAAKTLQENIMNELAYLEMNKARFETAIHPKEELGPDGLDEVEFLIATNIGEGMHPLSKIASGGELSRIMLGIKCVLASADAVSLLIFDEIDTGISGRTSLKIGHKLKQLAKDYQVICVTHSAQIASVAQAHYLISKEEKEGRVYGQVKQLDEAGRTEEIARIIGGASITPAVLATAQELLKQGSLE
ncbi:MAG: DNA repair protein RecN [Clostridiales bacterium]|nr:DNA repair protein RecN [Clostridiales bacterium]